MSHQVANIDEIPTSQIVVDALNKCFAQEDIDLRDITTIARQDPVVLINILFLVNEIISKRGGQVVNTLSAAINLVGLEPLKTRLLSIKPINPNHHNIALYELIRNRMYVAAGLTQLWADYMGQTTAEEMYCASMLTGMAELSCCLESSNSLMHSKVDVEDIESVKALYFNANNAENLLPDSIQCVVKNNSVTERLKLSILVYRLIGCIEYGYSIEILNKSLFDISEYIGISVQRAGYDLARELVVIERSANYHVWSHCQYLLTTNTEAVDPIEI